MHIYKQTLELRKRVWGDEHPDTLRSMNNLARLYSKFGRHQEAMQLDKQTVEAKHAVWGRAHPSSLSSARKLARISASGQTSQKNETKSPTKIPILAILETLRAKRGNGIFDLVGTEH